MGCGDSKGAQKTGDPGQKTPNGGKSATGGKKDKDGYESSGNGELLSEYVLGEVVGQGAFGVVYACAKKGTTEFAYAVKMVDRVETPVAEIKKEADLLKELEHPNVVRFYAVYYEKCFVCIVMDRYKGGDLIEGMQLHWKTRGKIPSAKVVHIVRGMIAGIAHMHLKVVIHRDVKGDNYLTDRKDIVDPDCQVIISDFGTAIKLQSPNDRLKDTCGTKIYWSPEFFSGNYSLKVDVWAIGVIVFGLLDGRFPFKGEHDVRSKPIRLPSTAPQKCQDLVLGMLERSEQKRMEAHQCLEHEWLSGKSAPAEDNMNEKVTGGDDFQAAANEDGLLKKEGGANGGQDERRKELVDRLEAAAHKEKATLTSLLWRSRFDVNDRRTGRTLRYEWRPVADVVAKKIIDLENAVQLRDNVGEVKVETVSKMLREHNIDTTLFGKGKAKSLEQFAAEVHAGSAALMLDAAKHKKLVRVVDVVLLRINFEKSGVKTFCTEFAETFKDGRSRDNLNRLPGTKKEAHENTTNTVDRFVKDAMGIDPSKISFDHANKEIFEEEEESRSYPGVTTIYRKEIVDGKFVTTDPAILKEKGATGDVGGTFTFKDLNENTKVFKWLTEQDMLKNGINFRAPAGQDHVSGLVQAPIGLSEDELVKFLVENNVDPKQFGCNNTKSLKDFSNELLKGESSLMVQSDGRLLRVVDIVLLMLKKEGTDDVLIEASEKFPDGRSSTLNRLPGSKRRPDENHFVTAQRVLKRQLKMDENVVNLNSKDVKVVEAMQESHSYPGLSSMYRKRIISAVLLQPKEKK